MLIEHKEAALQRCPWEKLIKNMEQIYRRTPMPKCDFIKVAKQLYWNCTSAWVFSCKFTAYFQNTFSQEHLWVAVSVKCCVWYSYLTPKTPFFGNEITSFAKRFQFFGHRFRNKYFRNIWLRLFSDCLILEKNDYDFGEINFYFFNSFALIV